MIDPVVTAERIRLRADGQRARTLNATISMENFGVMRVTTSESVGMWRAVEAGQHAQLWFSMRVLFQDTALSDEFTFLVEPPERSPHIITLVESVSGLANVLRACGEPPVELLANALLDRIELLDRLE